MLDTDVRIVRLTVLVTGCDADIGALIVIVVVPVCVLELVTDADCVDVWRNDSVTLIDLLVLVVDVVVLLLVIDWVVVLVCWIVGLTCGVSVVVLETLLLVEPVAEVVLVLELVAVLDSLGDAVGVFVWVIVDVLVRVFAIVCDNLADLV